MVKKIIYNIETGEEELVDEKIEEEVEVGEVVVELTLEERLDNLENTILMLLMTGG